MSNLRLRISAAFVCARIGWTHSGMFTVGMFKTMASLLELIMKVADEKRPRMTKLAIVVANEAHDVVSIWAGPTSDSDPYRRIEELHRENAELRCRLAEKISSNP